MLSFATWACDGDYLICSPAFVHCRERNKVFVFFFLNFGAFAVVDLAQVDASTTHFWGAHCDKKQTVGSLFQIYHGINHVAWPRISKGGFFSEGRTS